MFEDAEIIRVTRKNYKKLIEQAEKIHNCAEDASGAKTAIKFIDKNSFPTVEEMDRHKVPYNLQKYLPFLVYYDTQQIQVSDEAEYQKSRKYIRELISTLVDFIEDEDVNKIISINSKNWEKADFKKRCEIFAPLVAYYGRNEFSTFMNELGWQKFMLAYNYTQKNAIDGEECPQLQDDLALIWDNLQTIDDTDI